MSFISKKALGVDQITYLILKLLNEQLFPYLYRYFNNNFFLGYCRVYFLVSITVVIRKPSKPDYIIPKVYYPIALLNILKKALKFILAKRITYLAKTY